MCTSPILKKRAYVNRNRFIHKSIPALFSQALQSKRFNKQKAAKNDEKATNQQAIGG